MEKSLFLTPGPSQYFAILYLFSSFANVVCATNKASDQPVHTHSLIRAFASRSNILLVLSY